jgi:hypothetical protein
VGTEGSDRVEEIIREVSASVIEPRFTVLDPGEIHEKAAGEMVMVALVEAGSTLASWIWRPVPRWQDGCVGGTESA